MNEPESSDYEPGKAAWGFTAGIAVLGVVFAVVSFVNWEPTTEADADSVSVISTALLAAAMVGIVVFIRTWRGKARLWLYSTGVIVWALLPGMLAVGQGEEGVTSRDRLAMGWYWSLNPLPIDIGGPNGWEPPVVRLSNAEWFNYVGLQALTIVLVISGAGLIIAERRARNAKGDQPALKADPSSEPPAE